MKYVDADVHVHKMNKEKTTKGPKNRRPNIEETRLLRDKEKSKNKKTVHQNA